MWASKLKIIDGERVSKEDYCIISELVDTEDEWEEVFDEFMPEETVLLLRGWLKGKEGYSSVMTVEGKYALHKYHASVITDAIAYSSGSIIFHITKWIPFAQG